MKKVNQYLNHLMLIKSVFIIVILINNSSLFAQVKNASIIYVSDNSVFYVDSNTIDFSLTATTATSRTASNYGALIINSAANWSGASDNHFTDGFVRTLNSSNFTFPIGQSGTYAPAKINFSTSGTADAAYFKTAASSVGTTMDNSVTAISTIEYWKIASSNSATISLTWRSASVISSLTNSTLTDLIIIGYNGANWVQIPSAVDATSILGVTSSLTSGSITSTISIIPNAYQAFSLGYKGEACSPIVVSSGITKTWNGSWSPSAPTLSDPAVITSSYSGNLACNSLILNADITLANGQLVEIVNGATGDGKIIMASQASVVQRNSASTAPKIQLTKITNLMRRFDYVFLTSPINSDATFYSNLTSNQSVAVNGLFGSQINSAFSNFKTIDATGNVQILVTTVPIGKGLRALVRNQAPFSNSSVNNSWDTEKYPISIKIDGVANNGDVSVTVPSNSWAFVGNPYPSAIDGAKLLKAAGNNVRQTIYYWTFNTPYSYPSGTYSPNDWASWTIAGGVKVCGVCATPDGSIASMQSVYIKASTATPTTFSITNCMRKTINNTMFFKTQPKDRFWVNMIGIDNNSFSQILLAYSEEATVLEDPELDGERYSNNGTLLSSLIGDKKYAIQARPTFSPEDIVPLAVNQLNNQNCTISLGNKEGVFSTDNISIFLHDIQLGVYHDLSLSDYTFIQSAASDTTRFEITYQNPALNNDAFNTNKCVAFVNGGEFKIQASKTVNAIAIYDITGRKITEYFPNSRVYSHSFFHSIGVYFAKITFDDKSIATQKVVNGTK